VNTSNSNQTAGEVIAVNDLPAGSAAGATTSLGGGLQFQINYGAGVSDAVKSMVSSVTNYLSAHFTNPVTISIDIDWTDLGSNILGQTQNEFYALPGYSTIPAQLAATATSADDASTVAVLPATSPVSNGAWVATQAQLKAWGYTGFTSPDATITFSSSFPFDFDNSDGVTSGSYDFYGVAAHEITEVMGRILWQGSVTFGGQPVYMASDLFKYSNTGSHVFSSGTTAGYFSVDNGATHLVNYNTVVGGDFGDWSSTPNIQDAARAFAPSGTVEPVSDSDLRALDVIGWNRVETASIDLDPSSAGADSAAQFYEMAGTDTGANRVAIAANGPDFLSDTGSTRFTQLEVSIPDSQLAAGDQLRVGSAASINLLGTSGTTGTFSVSGTTFKFALANDGSTTSVIFTSTLGSTADSAPTSGFDSLVASLAYNSTSNTPVEGSTRSFDVTANDGFGWSPGATFNVTLHATNDAPTGAVTVTGLPAVGHLLTADTSTLVDPDGLGAFSYQWSAGGAPIGGATESTYTAQAQDVNATISVAVSYTDGGGTSENVLSAATAPVTAGTSGNDVITGTSGDDVLAALAGNDIVNALGGNDTLIGGPGADHLDGGEGSDLYIVAAGNEHSTAEFADTGSAGTDEVLFTATSGTLTIFAGDSGIETVAANSGTAALAINANAAPNGLSIEGNAGANKLTGSAFADTIDGGAGADTMTGGNGNDTYVVDNVKDVVKEASSTGGIDTVFALVNYTLGNNVENLTLGGNAAINGIGNTLANTITGNAASNVIDGKAGVDALDGGDGSDIYMVGAAINHPAAEIADSGASGIDEVRFAANSGTLTLFSGDTGIERVVVGTGTGATAISTGTGAANVNASAVGNGLAITGNSGANVLTGTAYDDTLTGGAGNDTLTGGGGADTFVFNAAGKDTITDFTPGTDVLQFSLAKFAAAGSASGAIDANTFWSAPGAITGHDADDRFVYDTNTGTLYYDADGNGSIAAVAVAVLGTITHPTLSASDMQLIS
jgi:Ca2+-binding RTX toxin-like protein